MFEQRIQQHFFDNADLHYASAEALAKPLLTGASAVVNCITSGARVWVVAEPSYEALARHAVACLVDGFERERPPLAAVYLDATGSGLMGEVHGDRALARRLQALAQPGDLLWVFARAGRHAPLVCAVQDAHELDMAVLAFTGADAGAIRSELSETDVLVAVPHERAARIYEIHLAALHALCDMVDVQLLGEHD